MPDFDQLKNFVIAKKPTNVFSKTIDSLKGLFATVGMPVDNVKDIAQHGGSWKGLWEKVRSKGLEKLGLEELASMGLAYANQNTADHPREATRITGITCSGLGLVSYCM